MGGDEINLNISPEKKIKNYGWPVASYGEHYSILKGKNNPINKEKYKKYPLLKSHSKNGFEEPIKFFTPGIGISEILKINLKFSNNLNDQILVASLGQNPEEGDHSLHYLILDDKMQITNHHILNIGDRIRDMIYIEEHNKILLYLESSSAIAILSKKK